MAIAKHVLLLILLFGISHARRRNVKDDYGDDYDTPVEPGRSTGGGSTSGRSNAGRGTGGQSSRSGSRRTVKSRSDDSDDKLVGNCGEYRNDTQSFPDIDYAFLGYDILKGFPLYQGSDPGFTYPIFVGDYTEESASSDCRFRIPRGLVVLPDVSCDVSFTSEVIRSSRQYEKSLSTSASVSGGGFGVQFSASAGYQEASSQIAKGEYTYIISTAKCNYYQSKLQDMKHPSFDPSFLEWVHRLDKVDEKEDRLFEDFFLRYGTHYPTHMTFGARYTRQHRMRSSDVKSMESKGFNVGVSASYSGLFSVGASFNLDSNQRSMASAFSSKAETKVITVGAAPPENGDAMTWASSVQDNPVPTAYSLDEIHNLFTEAFMGDLGVDYNKIQKNLKDKRILYWQMIQRRYGADNFDFDIEGSVMVPNWYVTGRYQEEAITFTDCFRICQSLASECYGMSFCTDCGQGVKSKCTIVDSYSRTDDWHFDENWKTVLVRGEMTLWGMKIADNLGEALEVIVVGTEGLGGQDEAVRARETCKTRFNYHRRPNSGDKAVAFTFGYLFNEIYAFCKIYGSKRYLTFDVRKSHETFLHIN